MDGNAGKTRAYNSNERSFMQDENPLRPQWKKKKLRGHKKNYRTSETIPITRTKKKTK